MPGPNQDAIRLATLPVTTKGLTVSSVAKSLADFGFSAAQIAAATRAYITCRVGGLMCTWSGVTPTSTLGHYCGPNQTLCLDSYGAIELLQVIREASVDAAVTITLET